MTLIVDFNARRQGGLYAALVPPGSTDLFEGSKVRAIDGEGLECQAEIAEIHPDYVLLRPIGGTYRDHPSNVLSDADLKQLFV